MFKMNLFFITLIMGLSSWSQAMDTETQRHFQFQEKKFTVEDQSCGLTHFAVSVVAEVSRVVPWNQGPVEYAEATSEMVASFTTNKSSCLKDYAVVQYIQGCTYDVFKKPGKNIFETSQSLYRKHRGQQKYFVHPHWEVDSTTQDPIYQATEQGWPLSSGGRLGYYGVPNPQLVRRSLPVEILADHEQVFEKSKKQGLYQTKLSSKDTSLFVTDRPERATYIHYTEESFQIAHNRVLNFKTCVYRLKDIPAQGDPAGMNISSDKGGPIACLDWSHNWVYNFNLNQFQPAWPNATPHLCRETSEVFDRK